MIILFHKKKTVFNIDYVKRFSKFIPRGIFAGVPANDNGIHVHEEVKAAGFDICAEELESIVEGHDVKKLIFHGGVDGIARKLHTCTTNGLSSDKKLLNRRQEIFGTNKFDEAQVGRFLVFVLEALQDMTLMILAVCAFVSLIVGIVMEGWPEGAHDGLGIVASILLGVFVTATIDYRQSLQFMDLDNEKKKTSIQVTRNGYRQKMSIYDLLPGDIVHLSIGDQVPADGLFLSGFFVSIDESSVSGESEPVKISAENPFLLSGTKVQDGSCKMMITTVGVRTQWGKLMATLSKGGDDETPLQHKLNGVATFIGKTGLAFAVVTFAVLVQGLFIHKLLEGTHWSWSEDDALEMLEFFAVAVTIVVVALKNDKALVRHLAACETIGSATSICSDKTGTLTTNRMTVVKACICMNVKDVDRQNTASSFSSGIPDSAMNLLLQSLCNFFGEVVANKEGKPEILGSPTEAALLEFGLFLDRDFQGKRQASKLIKVELFNSTEERMSVVLELPEGGLQAHTKGASEIILAACDKVIDSHGEVVPLDEATNDHLNATINQFASEALRTLCLAYMELENGFAPNDPIPLSGYTCTGIVGIKDPVRPGVKESPAISGSTGITVRMVTGDNINTAKAIARESEILGMDSAGTEVSVLYLS